MRASSIAAEVLYAGLMAGDDPRYVLYTVRAAAAHRLAADARLGQHLRLCDGSRGSGAAGGVFPEQANSRQDQRQVPQGGTDHRKGTRAGEGWKGSRHGGRQATPGSCTTRSAAMSNCGYSRLPPDAPAFLKAEVIGTKAATEKRIGGLLYRADKELTDRVKQVYARARDLYQKASELYPWNHWVLTQHLSIQAVLATPGVVFGKDVLDLWTAVRQIAQWDLAYSQGVQKAWALGTLAELQLLRSILDPDHFNADAPRRI